MTDHFNHNPNLFTASGCLSGPALEMKAKGLLTGKDLDRANEHLNGCGFCSDALEGLQIWLASQTERGEAVIKENYSPGKTEFVSKPVDFNTKISQLNERLLRKMEAGHPPIVEKSRRMPVYGWVAIAASLLLFVGIYLTLELKTVRQQQPLALEKAQPSGKSEAVNTLPDSGRKPVPESPPAPGGFAAGSAWPGPLSPGSGSRQSEPCLHHSAQPKSCFGFRTSLRHEGQTR